VEEERRGEEGRRGGRGRGRGGEDGGRSGQRATVQLRASHAQGRCGTCSPTREGEEMKCRSGGREGLHMTRPSRWQREMLCYARENWYAERE
jgi:hypothetical protein